MVGSPDQADGPASRRGPLTPFHPRRARASQSKPEQAKSTRQPSASAVSIPPSLQACNPIFLAYDRQQRKMLDCFGAHLPLAFHGAA